MMKKILFIICAFLMLFLTIASAVQAQSIYQSDWQPVYPNYFYYNEGASMPTVAGPYPRYYLAYQDFNTNEFHPDDFNHYDDFVGYQDLDVYYPDGRIDVLRNPYATELDTRNLHVPSDMQTFGDHVSGILPGGAIYTKHYNHEHAWDLNEDYYDYSGYGYGYFTPFIAQQPRPISTCQSCLQRSICQINHGCQ